MALCGAGDDETRVVSAESKRVAKDVDNLFLADFAVEIEVVASVHTGEVGCAWHNVTGNHPYGDNWSDCSSCADEVTKLAFDAGCRWLARIFTKGIFDRFGFELVVVGR